MTPVFAVSDRFVDDLAAADPVDATFMGIAGHDHRLTDYSPDGHAARAELCRSTLAALRAVKDTGPEDGRARRFLVERLDLAIEQFEAGTWAAELNVIACPLQALRNCLDVTAEPADVAARLAAIPAALEGWKASLAEGVRRGITAAQYQAVRAAEQARSLALTFASVPGATAEAADTAAAAFDDIADWLVSWYAPRGAATDGVGPDRYRLAARTFLGADVDPADTYAWGWEEVRRLDRAILTAAADVLPGAPLSAVFEHLEGESDFAVEGTAALERWAQGHVDSMIERFSAYFDIAEPVRRCEVRIAAPGGPASAYYIPPGEGFARPGTVWYPDLGRDRRYPLWHQVTTANHEAVPGHHLQSAQVLLNEVHLSRFQRVSFVSGHGEGWALYAERLCDELGLLDRPEAVLGFLAAQQLRAVRVVVDIGLHLDLPLPDDAAGERGAHWDRELAVDLLTRRTGEPLDVVRSEVDRYLGWPGQAISYKVGEREWLAARDDVRGTLGAAFDLRSFHTTALDLGPMGLGQLRGDVVDAALARAGVNGGAPLTRPASPTGA